MAESWPAIAYDARRAAQKLVLERHYRSAASRCYYAVYSQLAHELIEAKCTMPFGRSGLNHATLRALIISRLSSFKNWDKKRALALSVLVGRLYTLRINADYNTDFEFSDEDAREAFSITKKIFEQFL